MKYPDEVSVRAISLILPGDMLEICGRCARALNISRAQYIRLAIRRMNGQTLASLRSSRLTEASRRVRTPNAATNGSVKESGEGADA
jgi:hypothetical protein